MKMDAIWQADMQQKMFRLLLEAMSRPGSLQQLPPALHDTPANTALLATLLDAEVTLSDRHQQLSSSDWQLLQARPAEPCSADYILCDGNKVPDFEPCLGTLSSPDESATLIIQVGCLQAGDIHLKLQGPGIQGSRDVRMAGLKSAWLTRRQHWVGAFPLGVDIFLVDNNQLLALPRTTIVEVC